MLEIHVESALFLAYPMDFCLSIAQGNWIFRGNLSTLKLHFFGVSWLIIFHTEQHQHGGQTLHLEAKKLVDLSQANRSEFHGVPIKLVVPF